MRHQKTVTRIFYLGFLLAGCSFALHAAETNSALQIQQLLEDNAAMRAQMQKQQQVIDNLTREVAEIHRSSAERDRLNGDSKEPEAASALTSSGPAKVRLSGEGGVGFFETGSEGQFPNAEFRVDEAKLFVDASLWHDVYAFVELNLAERESPNVNLQLGEAYVEFEDVSQLWHKEQQLNIRVGRVDIPFGEEYQTRDAIDNPLISHSLTDFWGVDEGLKFYGSFGKFSYVTAVLNGGVPDAADFHPDKSIVARLSYDPCPRVHLSLSAMRTGELDVHNDFMSSIWFGGGWFRSLGSTNTTQFHDNLLEGDITLHLPRGHISAFGGCVFYDDNDSSRDNQRKVYYYSIEAVHDITRKFYATARFSQIFADKGFPIVGNGDMGHYLFGPLTEEIWRLSLGLGYRWNQHLALKTEYSFERGKELDGSQRDHEDLFATEVVFGF